MSLTEKFARAVIASYTRGDYEYTTCNHCSATTLDYELRAPHDADCVVLEAYKYLQIPVPVPDPEYNTEPEDGLCNASITTQQ